MTEDEESPGEELLKKLWQIKEVPKRDFSDNPTAQKVYLGEIIHPVQPDNNESDRPEDTSRSKAIVEEIDHMIIPESGNGNEVAAVRKRVPLELFLKLYPELDREELSKDNFEEAIDRAQKAGFDEKGVDTMVSNGDIEIPDRRDGHIEILKNTKKKFNEEYRRGL